MKQWYVEDWNFTIRVLRVRPDNTAESCRLGYEPGDTFQCRYECPAHFCPKCMLKVFPILEAVRSGGDLRKLGGIGPAEMITLCPDGVVEFHIAGKLSQPQ